MSRDEGIHTTSVTDASASSPSEDPRVLLVRQILASRTFAKSVRLSHFLEFVCGRALEGHAAEVNEQQIGIHVFGRSSAYNPTDDSIVRTQARLLRQRLEEYFEHECPTCPWVVVIPKGGYVPVFKRRSEAAVSVPERPRAEGIASPESPVPAADLPVEHAGSPLWRHRSRLVWGTLLCTAVAGLLLAHFLPWGGGSHPPTLWRSIFAAGRPVVIVPSDDGLVLVEELRQAPVNLNEYLSGSYLRQTLNQSADNTATADWLASHQYTSTADLNLALRLDHLPEAATANVTTRYARALRLDDLKSNNIVLIGGVGANPWVELFSHEVNFDVNYDWKKAEGYVINKKPQPGEQSIYRENRGENSPTSYGVLAYLPGISGEGTTLLFDGSGMAGTEAAADFPFSRSRFTSFLQQLGRGPGDSIPFFEVLLETDSQGGNAPQARIIGWRRLQH
jgi:hypothetical protein